MAHGDRAAIEALIYGYAERIDAGDLAGVGALFEGAVYRSDRGGRYDGAVAVTEVLTRLVKLHADGTPRTKHVTTNVIVEIDEAAGTATARSYFTVFQQTAAVPLQAIVAGRYHDRFARVGGVWRFIERLIYMDLVGDLHDHLRTREETNMGTKTGKFSRDELERAFIHYWRTGAAGEDWDAWADLFTEDCTYFEHWYGLMHGRETVRAWIVPIMDKYREIYTGYEWHVIDEDRGQVVFYVQNRRDHPSGKGTCDFPGVSIITYAGNGKWSREEDYWAVKGRETAMKEYDEARAKFDPDHPKKATRSFWGTGPDWIHGGKTYATRPKAPVWKG